MLLHSHNRTRRLVWRWPGLCNMTWGKQALSKEHMLRFTKLRVGSVCDMKLITQESRCLLCGCADSYRCTHVVRPSTLLCGNLCKILLLRWINCCPILLNGHMVYTVAGGTMRAVCKLCSAGVQHSPSSGEQCYIWLCASAAKHADLAERCILQWFHQGITHGWLQKRHRSEAAAMQSQFKALVVSSAHSHHI